MQLLMCFGWLIGRYAVANMFQVVATDLGYVAANNFWTFSNGVTEVQWVVYRELCGC